MLSSVVFSSNSDEWTTPKDLFAKLNEEFHFDIDVAATEENALCRQFITKEMDALKYMWKYVAWCNPPYSQVAKFIKRGYEQSLWGNTVVLLVPSRTDTKWWHEYVVPYAEVRFIKGRLKFSGSKNSAPFPSALVIFRGSSIT